MESSPVLALEVEHERRHPEVPGPLRRAVDRVVVLAQPPAGDETRRLAGELSARGRRSRAGAGRDAGTRLPRATSRRASSAESGRVRRRKAGSLVAVDGTGQGRAYSPRSARCPARRVGHLARQARQGERREARPGRDPLRLAGRVGEVEEQAALLIPAALVERGLGALGGGAVRLVARQARERAQRDRVRDRWSAPPARRTRRGAAPRRAGSPPAAARGCAR